MDAWLIAAVASELRADWNGARVERVLQPAPHDVHLQIYRAGATGQLLLSVHPMLDRAHLVADRPAAPPTPPAFCQALRRHLESSRLTGCSQPGLERLLELQFQGRDDLGNPRPLRLYVELTGRLANLVLVGPDGRILDALRRVDETVNRVRELLPGVRYAPPPRPEGKLDPVLLLREGGASGLQAALAAAWAGRAEAGAPLLQATVFGLTRPLAQALAAWAAGAPGAPPAPGPPGLAAAVTALAAAVAEARFAPCVGSDRLGRPQAFAWPPPGTATRPAPSASAACAAAYGALAALHQAEGLRQRLHSALRTARDRLQRRLERQGDELTAAQGAEALREQGELLLSRPQLVPRGAGSVALPALTDPTRLVAIVLDPSLSVSGNAQRLLKRYQKEKRAATEVARRVSAGQDEERYLAEAELALQQAESGLELQALEAELTEQGLCGERRDTRRRAARPRGPGRPAEPRAHAAAPPLVFAAGLGWQALVGRNAAGNDHLTLRLGRPEDLWLHARQMPGSHVLLRAPAEGAGPAASAEPPEAVLLAAARCAAYYSAGRAGTRIPVDWTRRRSVWKPAGARPGLVLYAGEHTLLVDPVDLPPRAPDAPARQPQPPGGGLPDAHLRLR